MTWFHFSKAAKLKVVIDGGTMEITRDEGAEISHIKEAEGTFLLVDGVTKDNYTPVSCACVAWASDENGRQFSTVSSTSVVVALEQLEEVNVVQFTVGSWQFEELEAACANDEFFESVKQNLVCPGDDEKENKPSLLLHKYHFAGGCARWMFEFSYLRWQKDFKNHFAKVYDYSHILGEGGARRRQCGGRQPPARRHCDSGRGALFREVFLRQQAKADATQNPAYRGWIFEFDVDYQLRTACDEKKQLPLKLHMGLADASVAVSVYQTFDSIANLFTLVQAIGDHQVLWVKPELWCQKAYDFLCFYKVNVNRLVMVAVNATYAKTHSVRLDVVNVLATTLGQQGAAIDMIRFDFIVPTDAEFRVSGEVTGRLVQWNSLRGAPWPNQPSSQVHIDEGCIAVCVMRPTMK